MKRYFLLLPLICVFLSVKAQISTCVSDTLLFRECFSDSILRTDLKLMGKVYNNILGGPKVSKEIWIGTTGVPTVTTMRSGGVIDNVDQGFHLPWSISHNVVKSNLHEILRRQLFQEYSKQHPRGWNVEEAKEVLIKRLQRFDSLASHKPLFFSTIYTDYGGNITQYVNELYDTSIMGNKKVLRDFMKKTSTLAIQKDLGYQFSLSLALYEQWIAQVRNGEINEE